ncbi:MAG: primosomal protein [Demequina sp.]
MTSNSRDALRLLVAAFEEHLEAVASRRSADDAAVDDAYEALAEIFEKYEEALDLEFAESLPLVVDDSDDFEEGEASNPRSVDEGDDDEDDEDDDDDDDFDDIEEFDLKS